MGKELLAPPEIFGRSLFEEISRRTFLRLCRDRAKDYLLDNVQIPLEVIQHLEGLAPNIEMERTSWASYGFATENIPARIAPSFDARVVSGTFQAFPRGSLIRFQEVASRRKTLAPGEEAVATEWGQVIQDKRWTPYSWRPIGNPGQEIYVPLNLLSILTLEDFTPIHPEIDPRQKVIEVILKQQRLIAYEEGIVVLDTLVSTGIKGFETPMGAFRIYAVRLARRMAGVDIVKGKKKPWELPFVPFVMFFGPKGEALHGTYWHNNFGTRRSHGCVNLPTQDAWFLFRWIYPQMPNPYSQEEYRAQRKELTKCTPVIIR